MGYRRAEEILPAEVIQLIQEYVDGQNIYIPRKPENKLKWGAGTDTAKELQTRNQNIYAEYLSGKKVDALAEKYFLSKKSIHRIIREKKS